MKCSVSRRHGAKLKHFAQFGAWQQTGAQVERFSAATVARLIDVRLQDKLTLIREMSAA